MYKNRISFLICISLIFSSLVFSQNSSTNSPYTRFGFGSMSDNANGARRALGGTSIGFRSAKEINTVNPASYSAVDTLSFMFDVGLSGMYSHFSDENGSIGKLNGNLEYINLQFPVTKFLGISAGLLPYSFSGYTFSNKERIQFSATNEADTAWATKSYSGSGTVSQFYFGVAGKFLKHFSAGINAYYMFGDISNQRATTYNPTNYNPTSQDNRISISAFRLRYGLQYFNTINGKHDISVGVFYENKMNMSGVTYSKINFSQVLDTISNGGFLDYLQYVEENAVNFRDIQLNSNDKIVTLSTCTNEYENTRMVLLARLVPAGN